MNQNSAETSVSLLDAVRQSRDEVAWQRMSEIYSPLIEKWLRRFSAPNQDIKDLVQDVLTVVVRKIDTFERQPRTGAFRAWLRNIARNCLLQFWREKKITPVARGDSDFQQVIEQLAVETSELSQKWNQEYDEYVLKSVLNSIKGEFKEQTWEAFQGVTLDEKKPREVAEELDMTVNAVFIAKSRVLSRLRSHGQGLIDI